MSSPNASPVGPTRFAESNTSMPPPDPRSSTVSPGLSSARAVGFPQPSEASTAADGRSATSSTAYRSLVMTLLVSVPQLQLASVLQQAFASSMGNADSAQVCSWVTL